MTNNMTSQKRVHDPDYEDIPPGLQEKRMRLIEEDKRKQTKMKIESIIKYQFQQEFVNLQNEIKKNSEQIQENQSMLDKLRAAIITKYYTVGPEEQVPSNETTFYIHPAVKTVIGKTPLTEALNVQGSPTAVEDKVVDDSNSSFSDETLSTYKPPSVQSVPMHAPRNRIKLQLVVGNVSKFIHQSLRFNQTDDFTHVWKAYVREGKNCPKLSNYVDKVCFMLHPSFSPNNKVEVSEPPFELCCKGWGDFPLQVRLHFKDPTNKPFVIIHQLKLDKTYTGLTTPGPETHVDIQLLATKDFISPSCSIDSGIEMCMRTDETEKRENTVAVLKNPHTTEQYHLSSQSAPVESANRVSYAVPESHDYSQPNSAVKVIVPSNIKVETSIPVSIPAKPNNVLVSVLKNNNLSLTSSVQTKLHVLASSSQNSILKLNNVNGALTKLIICKKKKKGNDPSVNGVVLKLLETKPSEKPLNEHGLHQILSSVRIQDNSDFKSLLKKVTNLISFNVHSVKGINLDHSVFPFITSINEYQLWNVGKRNAAQWHYAGLIRQSIIDVLQMNNISSFPPEFLWTRKQIIVWLRKHGYIPAGLETADKRVQDIYGPPTLINSYAEPRDVLKILDATCIKTPSVLPLIEEVQEEIDVISVEANSQEAVPVNLPPSCSKTVSPESMFIRQAASELFITLKPVEMEPTIFMPVIEEMLLAATKSFAEDILRSAISQGYKKHAQAGCSEVTISDTYLAIQEDPSFEFLTNHHIGSRTESTSNS